MVSKMTFDEAVETLRRYYTQRGLEGDPQVRLLEFLGWADPAEGRFGEDVRIVLAAPGFTQEVTSTVLWLNEHDLDFRCVRLQPYRLAGSILLDVQQIIPLPEAGDYQVQIRQKQREARAAVEHAFDWTRYDVTTGGEVHRRLSKREVMYVACRFLVAQGIAPDDIERTVDRKLFESVDGEIDGPSFRAELARRHPNDARATKRSYSADEQLVRHSGKTYALTNQWGKDTMEPAMLTVVTTYGELGISYSPSDAEGS
jgi:hypothetical protein